MGMAAWIECTGADGRCAGEEEKLECRIVNMCIGAIVILAESDFELPSSAEKTQHSMKNPSFSSRYFTL